MRSKYIGIASAMAGVALVGALGAFATMASATTAPTVSSVSPNTGTTAGGTMVTITGTDLNGATAVDFGATPATSVTASSTASSTSLTAVSPADATAGPVDVTVMTPDGTSATSSADQFTYTAPAPAAPTVTSIAPSTGTTAGGTMVTITGTGLTGATAVDFGGVAATGMTASSTATDTSLTAISPANATAGPVDVTVMTPGGTSATSSADQFTYTAPVTAVDPVISNISAMATGTSTETISWTTDVPSSSQVEYGTTASYTASSTLDMTSTTTHSVMLSNLAEASLYHFAVMSADSTGTTTSDDNEFVTQSTASSTPLAIDGVTTTQSSGVADDTFADGWQWVIHFTVPDNENAFRIRFSDWGNASSSFPTANDVEIYSPESSNASSSSSAIIETDNGYSNWIYLNGDTTPLTPGDQIDLYVNVQIPFGTPAGSYSSNFTAETYPSTATSTAI